MFNRLIDGDKGYTDTLIEYLYVQYLSLENTYADAMQLANPYTPSELKTIMLPNKFAVLPRIL